MTFYAAAIAKRASRGGIHGRKLSIVTFIELAQGRFPYALRDGVTFMLGLYTAFSRGILLGM